MPAFAWKVRSLRSEPASGLLFARSVYGFTVQDAGMHSGIPFFRTTCRHLVGLPR